jgi:hypothetical protein
MKARVFWMTSLICVVVAIFSQIGALSLASQSGRYYRLSRTASESEKLALMQRAKSFGRISNFSVVIGWVTAAASAVLLLASYTRKEAASRLVQWVCMAVYMFLFFAQV